MDPSYYVGVVRPPERREVTATASDPARTAVRTRAPIRRSVFVAGFAVLLAGGAALRFWSLPNRPGWQYDETVYIYVGTNLLQHGTINEHITYGAPWTPDLYEPPYYFLILARWFALTGASMYHARVLGVLFSLGTLVLLWRLIIRIGGQQMAFFSMIPIVFDGWLLFIQRISYMENMLLLLITAGMLLYKQALDNPTKWRFVVAGVVLGFAVAVKYTGASVIAGVLLCWFILRRNHGGHMTMLGAAMVTFAGCAALEASWFDTPGHDWWAQQTLIQIKRVLGLQQSGGTLTSFSAALHLMLAQYDVFAFSFAVAAAAFVMVIRRLWTCCRARSWESVKDNSLLWSWMLSGLVVFGVSSLKFPQYFALILVPMYAWFWTEVYHWRWSWRRLPDRGGLP